MHVHAQALSHVQLFETPWTVAYHAPLSVGFSRQKYSSGLPCLSLGHDPDPGSEPKPLTSPALAGGFLPLLLPGNPNLLFMRTYFNHICVFTI